MPTELQILKGQIRILTEKLKDCEEAKDKARNALRTLTSAAASFRPCSNTLHSAIVTAREVLDPLDAWLEELCQVCPQVEDQI